MKSSRLSVLLLAGVLPVLSVVLACSGNPAPATPAQAPAPPPVAHAPEALDATLPVDPAITLGHLPNGLTYYVRQNPAPTDREELWLVVNAGSVLEDDDQRGLAHFVEHMAFNGTTHFKRQELVDYLESIGMRFGPDVNAFTAFDKTIYQLTVPTDRKGTLAKGVQILEDWAHGMTFDPHEVDQERGVITEEWRLGRGAEARERDAQAPLLFAGSRYADRLPIGSKEVIETASPETIRRFYHDWYRPDLMAVIAVGDVPPPKVEALIRKHFAGLTGPAHERERPSFSVPDHDKTLFGTFTDPELTDTAVSVYTKLPPRPEGTVDDYRRSLIEGVYHRMLNDRLYEVGHSPDPPFLYAYSATDPLVRSAQVDEQEAGVRPGEVDKGLEALLTEIERVRRHGFTAGELERTKRDLLRAYERTYLQRENRASPSYASEYSRNFLTDEPIPGIQVEVELARRFVPEITLDQVNALADLHTQQANRVILVSGPKSQASKLPSEDDLLAVYQKVQGLTLAPYEDKPAAATLVPDPPKPGTIVSRREIPEIGVTEWHLSNGVTVVLKPTQFRTDQVLIEGFSPGGSSLVDDKDALTASYADAVVSLGGLGNLDEIALAKAMAGKVVSVHPHIDELEEGVSASGSTDDLPTLFQLAYLALTRPRLDVAAVESYRSRLRPGLENRLADPGQAFVERMIRELNQDHPRRQPLTPERLDQIDPQKALEIYKDRFADLGDATFVIVGAFDPVAIEPSVLTYLATLPSTGRHETWRDLGIRRPDKPVEFTMERGLEPKGRVWLVLHGPETWSRDHLHALRSLADALELRLREVLREDLGAVYNVSVDADLAWRPKPRYSISIQFGCNPTRARALVDRVHKEILAFQSSGPDAELVAKVRELERRERQTAIQDNSFWIGALSNYYRMGQDPRQILGFDELVRSLSPEKVRQAARKYLHWDRRVLGILVPQEGAPAAPAPATAPQAPPKPGPVTP